MHLPALRQLTLEWDAADESLVRLFTRHASQLASLTLVFLPYTALKCFLSQRLNNLTSRVWPLPQLRHLACSDVSLITTLNLADFPNLSSVALSEIAADAVSSIPHNSAHLITECVLFTTPPELQLLASLTRLCKLRLHCTRDSPPLLTLAAGAIGDPLLAFTPSLLRQILPCAPRLSVVCLVPQGGDFTAAEEAYIPGLVRDEAAVSFLVVHCCAKAFARFKSAIGATRLCWLLCVWVQA